MRAEHQKGDEVEEGGPRHRMLRPQHARRHDGGDRIGSVVQAIEEVEGDRDQDQRDQQRQRERDRVHVGAAPALLRCSLARPSSCDISSLMLLIRPAWVLIEERSGAASCTRAAVVTITSAISFMIGVNERWSNNMMVLAVFCIWSMALSIEVIRSLMSPRSNGVMKLRRIAIRTSRVMLSASCSRSMTVL